MRVLQHHLEQLPAAQRLQYEQRRVRRAAHPIARQEALGGYQASGGSTRAKIAFKLSKVDSGKWLGRREFVLAIGYRTARGQVPRRTRRRA
jgi:hypothetical protein